MSSSFQASQPQWAEADIVMGWDNFKDEIATMYENTTLPNVIDYFKKTYGFKKTPKRWKTQLSKWGLDIKNIKKNEKLAMVRKKRGRKAENKRTQFKLRGKDIPNHKIVRFERAMPDRTSQRPRDYM
ncbi:MAG: hypothetical protein M1820_009565 [Bogoriella megaspora]|nr:MAG: hypothetical protein M1820_009565 [Bogoriella megaspora]